MIRELCHFKSDYYYRKTIKTLEQRGLIARIANTKGKNIAYCRVKTSESFTDNQLTPVVR